MDALIFKDSGAILDLVEKLVMDGKDIAHFTSDLILYFRNLLICKITDRPSEIIETTTGALEGMKRQALNLTREQTVGIIKELSALEPVLKWSTQPRIILEVNLLKLCDGKAAYGEDLEARVAALEKKLDSGIGFSESGKTGYAVQSVSGPTPDSPPTHTPSEQNPEKTPSVKKSAADPKLAGSALEDWPKVIAELRKSGRMALYASLMDTKALSLDEKVIGVLFKKGARLQQDELFKAGKPRGHRRRTS